METLKSAKVAKVRVSKADKALNELESWIDKMVNNEAMPWADRFTMVEKKVATYVRMILDRRERAYRCHKLYQAGDWDSLYAMSRRYLSAIRDGKGKARTVHQFLGRKLGMHGELREVTYRTRKGGKVEKVARQLPANYLRGGSQSHLRRLSQPESESQDALHAALAQWLEKSQAVTSESSMVEFGQIWDAKGEVLGMVPLGVQLFGHGWVRMGAISIANSSRDWKRPVCPLAYRIKRDLASEDLPSTPEAKASPSVSLEGPTPRLLAQDLGRIKNEIKGFVPTSNTENRMKAILLQRLNGAKNKEIARLLGFPISYVENALTKAKRMFPDLLETIVSQPKLVKAGV